MVSGTLKRRTQSLPSSSRSYHWWVQRRQQEEKIKIYLCQSPAVPAISRLLGAIQQSLQVCLNTSDMENPDWRLVWEVTFGYDAPWIYCYFYVRRLFAGQELAPHCDYLGPAWEAPDILVDYTDEALMHLLSREEVEVVSAAGARRIQIREADWEQELQVALQEAYQRAFYRGY